MKDRYRSHYNIVVELKRQGRALGLVVESIGMGIGLRAQFEVIEHRLAGLRGLRPHVLATGKAAVIEAYLLGYRDGRAKENR